MTSMITRTPLRVDIHRELLRRILGGEFPPGARLRDSELAPTLGVSRTPVREALLRLEREGILASRMGKGFSVLPLSETEALEVYPLVGLLECRALCALPPLTTERAAALEALDLSRSGGDPLPLMERDTLWHRTLLEPCGNAHLLRILEDLKRIIVRFEFTFMEVPSWVAESAREHRAILEALAGGRVPEAEHLLAAHWERSLHSLLTRLRPRPNP
jgi:DNA-binding GntR family transcriptional regulator